LARQGEARPGKARFGLAWAVNSVKRFGNRAFGDAISIKGRGLVRHGAPWHCKARRGKAWAGNSGKHLEWGACRCISTEWRGQARLGTARRGAVWQGKARHGQ